ncbi:MAG: hypothetical protein IJV98_08705 [Clostridia bacterium]|nr:hypothetical protein [Clostridia bacterium]
MPALLIDSCSQLKDILKETDTLIPHNWLISNLECYDTTGWEGCEKWARRTLILTDEELKHDVYLRDMQFIWGVFSAIPKEYERRDMEKYAYPALENISYMANRVTPQHPMAFLEISVWDGSHTYICAHDKGVLQAFCKLPYDVIDLENDNRIMNRELCRIQDTLHHLIPSVSEALQTTFGGNAGTHCFVTKRARKFPLKKWRKSSKPYTKRFLLKDIGSNIRIGIHMTKNKNKFALTES